MLTILWLTVWATVGEAVYDDYNWYTTEDGGMGDDFAFRKNFSDTLKTFADTYGAGREGDDEMTIAKAKTKLRMLKIFQYTGNSNDFDAAKGQTLPLAEGAKYCTMGRHTKVDCNHCTCVAGQLYMCTGMLCPKPLKRPQYLSTCREGKQRKIDSCNYCYCRNGHEFCSTKDCRHNHEQVAIRSGSCPEGKRRRVACNRCLCHNSEEYCTNRHCKKKQPSYGPFDSHVLLSGKCKDGTIRQLDSCNSCYCHNGEEFCENKDCGTVDEQYIFLRNDIGCLEGTIYKTDSCNHCYCFKGKEICTHRICADTDVDGKECHPLRDYVRRYIACNYCQCRNPKQILYEIKDDKWYWTCTKRECEKSDDYEDNNYRIHLLRKGKQCDQWDVKYIHCNYCKCYNGNWACTKKLCKKPKIIDNDKKIFSDDGSNYLYLEACRGYEELQIDSCNTCFCRHGQWFCPNKECASSENTIESSISDKTKNKKDTKIPDNSENNKHTKIADPTDNEVYYDYDRSYDHLDKRDWDGIPCVAGSDVKIDSCNTCYCRNRNWYCETEKCVAQVDERYNKRTTTSCVEGVKYKLSEGCNYCVCQNGQEFCTARACLVDDTKKNTGCNEGDVSSAGDSCNLCVCFQGKITCTNKDCSRMGRVGKNSQSYFPSYERNRKPSQYEIKLRKQRMTQGKNQKCIPGKYYTPDNDDPMCPNNCICDRRELLCTHKKCNQRGEPMVAPLSWSSQNKYRNAKQLLKHETCVENQPLPSDDPCNSCMCLNDRKVCTIISCADVDDSYKANKGNSKGSKGNKGNMEGKKSGFFCRPFTFFSPDNNRFCRNCFCLHNGLALCLLNLCKYSKDIPEYPPEELNDVCRPGEIGYPTKCVTCTCSSAGKWTCTREELALCNERDCDEKDEFQMGFFPFCAGCKCSVKEWFCSIQSETCKGNATCPLGAFIHNPRQHCSLCLCGGYEEGSHNMCFTEAKCVRQVLSHLKD